MGGVIDALARHPVKGFTPERLRQVDLTPEQGFPFDRVFAVEDGASGFDSAAPAHISKMKFTVLAKIPALARVRSRWDDASGLFHAEVSGAPAIAVRLSEADGRERFAAWLTSVLAGEVIGPLRVLPAPGAHRFFDHPRGAISLINLASVRDIEARIGRPVDPLRFRANIYVSGWPAWQELAAEHGAIKLGAATARVFAPITRCAATHVDPATGARDIEMVEALRSNYGHLLCGLYLHVENGGLVRVGDRAELSP
jgi:uncharacterized protein